MIYNKELVRMQEYISRTDAIKALKEDAESEPWDYSPNDAITTINIVPTANVAEVIRCKDCKHNSSKQNAGNALCDLFYGMTDQEGYCHLGEKK